jgi:RNA polymerase sigma factor (sigma-70 family)
LSDSARATVETVWRIESARLIAKLARSTGDVGLAEELAADAFVAALEQWPHSGVPANPGAWLMAVAKRRGIDRFRRLTRLQVKYRQLVGDFEIQRLAAREPAYVDDDDDFGDDLLRLIFVSCHPVLAEESRIALTLRLLGGLTTEEIARAFLVPRSTVAQRIVRAKRTLAAARVPFEVPDAAHRTARLASVLKVVYLIFNEGYCATAGGEWVRTELCEEALRLGRMLAALLPGESEVHGLLALMQLHASRIRARTGAGGEIVTLPDQDRARWNDALIRRGLASLARAKTRAGTLGPYALQAAIAARHARARTAKQTDWEHILALYDALAETMPSPVVELNRAVAVAMVYGPAAALEIADALASEATLRRYYLLPAVRGDFLAKLGRFGEAKAELERAAQLSENLREREFLRKRAAAVSAGSAPD